MITDPTYDAKNTDTIVALAFSRVEARLANMLPAHPTEGYLDMVTDYMDVVDEYRDCAEPKK